MIDDPSRDYVGSTRTWAGSQKDKGRGEYYEK